jgi:hypothetical protein
MRHEGQCIVPPNFRLSVAKDLVHRVVNPAATFQFPQDIPHFFSGHAPILRTSRRLEAGRSGSIPLVRSRFLHLAKLAAKLRHLHLAFPALA